MELEQFASDALDDRTKTSLALHITNCSECAGRLTDVRLNLEIGRLVHSVLTDVPTERSQPPLPESIGPYTVRREIGRGGMGVVYEGMQKDPARRVALKVLRAHRTTDEHYHRLLRHEASVLARLRHPMIATIYDAGCTAEKNIRSPQQTRSRGRDVAGPGSRSMTNLVPAAVPSVTHSSSP